MPRQIQGSQTDFSFGQVDVALKRNDSHPARKGGLRQMVNARILNSAALQNRPGRRALYPTTTPRIEEISPIAGTTFKLAFNLNRVEVRDNAGVIVFSSQQQGNGAVLPWTAANLKNIVYAVLNLSIYIAFVGMRPQVITWDGVATWTIADFNEAITAGGQKRTPFYRMSPQNVTALPSATQGAITITFSSPIVVAGMQNTRLRFAGRQVLLGAPVSTSVINATVMEPLPPSQTLTLASSIGKFNVGDVINGVSGAKGIATSTPSVQSIQTLGFTGFNIGDTVTGGTSGATGIVLTSSFPFTVSLNTGTAFVAGENITGPSGTFSIFSVGGVTMVVQLIQAATGSIVTFSSGETIGGTSGSGVIAGAGVATVAPTAISVWDEEVINDFRGYPASVFVDQFRLGFCNFKAIPGGIGWSAINSPTDLFVDGQPSNAMFEIAPRKVQVLHVVPGPEGSEFVFCDRALFYIPISPTNPLKPGSVVFQLLSGDGCAQVQPRVAQEAILYVNAGLNSVMAVIATGAYTRPYNTKNLSDYHSLFNNILAIAAPTADGTFNERYAYVLNGDGSIAVGKYSPDSLQTQAPVIGWGPWSGVANVTWIAAFAADVIFSSSYFGYGVCEILDDAQYLDCALPVNAPPAAFAPPGGQGPLWFIPSQTVSLMDQVTRSMGTYQTDARGFITPQNNGGENLAAASLVAGQPWTMTVEPFAPDATSGADVGQRMRLRQISNFAVYVINSTGFYFAALFSARQTRTTPALGTVQQTRRVPAWNQDDDPTLPPTQRETVEMWPPPGSSFDPRVAVVKDTPGPLLIAEIGMEVTL